MFARSKYGNKKTIVDGIAFDSKKEADRYKVLRLLERAGEISNLTLQPKYILQDGFKKNGKKYREIAYIADFYYSKNGQVIIEDVKGKITKEYAIKKKLFELKYPSLTITEI